MRQLDAGGGCGAEVLDAVAVVGGGGFALGRSRRGHIGGIGSPARQTYPPKRNLRRFKGRRTRGFTMSMVPVIFAALPPAPRPPRGGLASPQLGETGNRTPAVRVFWEPLSSQSGNSQAKGRPPQRLQPRQKRSNRFITDAEVGRREC